MGIDGVDDGGGGEVGLCHVCDCPVSENPSHFRGIPHHINLSGDGTPFSNSHADFFYLQCFPQHRYGQREGGGRAKGVWAQELELNQSDAPLGVFGTLNLQRVTERAGTVGNPSQQWWLGLESWQ